MPHPTGHPERPSQRSPPPALQMRHRTSTLEPRSGSKAGSASGHFSLAQKATCSRRASRTAGSGQGGGQVGGRSWLAAISARAAAHQRRRSGRARVRSAQKKKFQNKKKKRPAEAAAGRSAKMPLWSVSRATELGARPHTDTRRRARRPWFAADLPLSAGPWADRRRDAAAAAAAANGRWPGAAVAENGESVGVSRGGFGAVARRCAPRVCGADAKELWARNASLPVG